MLLNLKEVFSNKIFRIPSYQRGYSWEEKHLGELWNDIKNILYPNPSNSFHFTGILTLNKFSKSDLEKLANENHGYTITEDNKVEIDGEYFSAFQLVDGQQRMTSLLILISLIIEIIIENDEFSEELRVHALESKNTYLVLYDENNKTKHLFGYDTDTPSHQFLLNRIFDDSTIECTEPETLYTNRLSFAKTYFEEKLKKTEVNDIEKIFYKIEERLLFAILDLNDDENKTIDVSMAFETLNFRGKSLSNLELFKNRLLYLVHRKEYSDEEDRIAIKNDIVNTWLEIYKWIGANPGNELNDDEFLKAFWLLKFSDREMVSDDFKGWVNDIFNDKFSIERNVNRIDNSELDEIAEWLELMRNAIELWFIIKNPYFLDSNPNVPTLYNTRLSKETKETKLFLSKIETFPRGLGSYMQNLILSILYKGLLINNESESKIDIDNLLRLIERHNVGCFLFNGNKTNYHREDAYRSVNSYLKTGHATEKRGIEFNKRPLATYLEEITTFDLDRIYPTIHYGQRYFSWAGIQYFLYHWELHLAKQKGVELNFENIKQSWKLNLLYRPIDADAPRRRELRKFGNIDTRLIATRDKYAYSLGNLFLSKNDKSKSRVFYSIDEFKQVIDKRKENKDNISFNELELYEYDCKEWNEATIFERGKKMLKFSFKNWELLSEDEISKISNAKFYEILLDMEPPRSILN